MSAHLASTLAIGPGVALAAAIASFAYLARHIPGMATFSPMILAIVIGMSVHNLVGTPSIARPGIAFSLRFLLRVAIVLLGCQLTLAEVADLGAKGLLVVAGALIATFVFTVAAGRVLGVDQKLSELIAAGTSICGASAIVATNSVTEAHDEDVAYAIACVTLFGSIAMFTYPPLSRVLHLGSEAHGLWSGASIHEIAQVVAASFQNGQRAGEIGTVAKLARVMLLAPVVVALGIKARLSASRASTKSVRPPMPWFVLGFVALVGVNSAFTIPATAKDMIVTVTSFLLSTALAAMGLETDLSKLRARGVRPAVLGALAFLFIATFSLTLIKLME
ncbi:YeiH family protein [Bradyrhizobium cenepequi]